MQSRNTKVQINEEQIGKQPEKQFRIMIVMIQKLENRMEKMQETFNTVSTITKDIGETKSKQI